VNGLRGDSSLEERLRYDLEYIDRWSLLFDLEILGRTAVQVVVGRNAY
jgi:lipopolysaccharide/colanic/teichoic acid biosynthesis glycosyltransferase